MYYFKYITLFLTHSIQCAWDSGTHGSVWWTLSCGKWHCVVWLKFTYVSEDHTAHAWKLAAACSSLTVTSISLYGTTYKNIFQLTWNSIIIKNSTMSHKWPSIYESHFGMDIISTVQFSRFSPQLILITVHRTWNCMNLKWLSMKTEIRSGSCL